MTSPPPLLYDTYYHIFNRGINRENIFIEERNFNYFLQLYTKYIEPVAITFAYCLLRNHFHFLLRIRSEVDALKDYPDCQTLKVSETFRVLYPSKRFSDFFNAYAKSINKAYGRTGSLFQHPFGRVVVTSHRYFWNVVAYIHQNPQKHKLIDDFREWKYSSYGAILTEKPTRIDRGEVLNWFGGPQGYKDLHAKRVTEVESNWFSGDDFD